MNSNVKKYQLLTGNALKILAIFAMLTDHIGAVLLEKGLLPLINNAVFSGTNTDYTMNDYHTFTTLDLCFRIFGRIAFPIFLFLLVEGFLHTRDPFKYAFRLFIFALVSEVPFDLAVNGCFFELGYQNVFFTLTLSVLMYIGLELTDGRIVQQWLNTLIKAAIIIIVLIAATILRCDYSALGIAMALFMYLFRYNRKQLIISEAVIIVTYCILDCLQNSFSLNRFLEVFALLAFLPIAMYNGERGSFKLKYFFYIFYPAHLVILALIKNFVIWR